MGLRSEEQQRLAELHREHVLSVLPAFETDTTGNFADIVLAKHLRVCSELCMSGEVLVWLPRVLSGGRCSTGGILQRAMSDMLDRFGD